MASNPTGTSGAQCPSQVQVALDRHRDAHPVESHVGGHHLAGELGTRGERAKEQVTGTGSGTRATDALMGSCRVDRAPDVDGAAHRAVGGAARRPEGDPGGVGRSR